MQIFISWSGESSREIAGALKNWLPKVLQAVKPYYTPDDIEKGAKWLTDILKKLNDCTIGIICVTPENVEKPWILFEAGALSNRSEIAIVCPLLFNIKKANISGPLGMFQLTEFNKKDFYDLLKTINSKLGNNSVALNDLQDVFEAFYPKLEKEILEIIDSSENDHAPKVQRGEREILEEILDIVRRTNQSSLSPTDETYSVSRANKEALKPVFRYIIAEEKGMWVVRSYVSNRVVVRGISKKETMGMLSELLSQYSEVRVIIYNSNKEKESDEILYNGI